MTRTPHTRPLRRPPRWRARIARWLAGHNRKAAPDMAETIAGMKTEYAVQSKAGALTQLYYGRDVIWTDTELTAWQVAHEIGGVVVRRFVTDPEVVEP
jgi:hypothetical protein